MEENQVIYNWDAPWVIESKQQSNNEQLAYQQYLDESKKYGREPFAFEQWKSTQNSQYQPLVNDPKAKPGKGKTLNEKAKNYNKPLKGVAQRFEASMDNKTNPYWGLNTMAKVVGAAGIAYTPIAAFKYGPQVISTIAAQPYGLQNLAVSTGTDLLAGTAGSIVGSKVDKALGGDGALGGVLGGFGAAYAANLMPWKQDLNKALTMNPPKQSDINKVIKEQPGSEELTLYIDGNTAYTVAIPNLEPVQALIAENNGASIYSFNNAAPHTVEMHFGSPNKPPLKRSLLWARDVAQQLPSGTFITPISQAQTRASRYYHNGFFSKPTIIDSARLPASTDGYRSLLAYGKKYPEMFDINFAENYTFDHWFQPHRKALDPTLQNLHKQAFRTKDLTNLNNYLKSLGGKPAYWGNNGRIQYPLPILIKK